MNFLELTRQRYSLRAYSEKAVEREVLSRCTEAARMAPSACNAQPWHFVIADDRQTVNKLGAAATVPGLQINSFVSQAPVVAVLVTEKPNIVSRLAAFIKDKPYYLIDIGIAAEHFCLQAAEEGLGTCIMGWFNESKVKEITGIPVSKSVALLITVGYPARELPPEKKRKKLEDILSWDRYGGQ